MRLGRNFFSKNENTKAVPFYKNKLPVVRDKDGRVHVVMYTSIFHDASQNLLASNSMYANLLTDLQPCVEPYSPKEKIMVDVYETKPSDEFARDLVVVGFRKYVNSCLTGLYRQHLSRFLLFFSFLLVGIAIEVILYAIPGMAEGNILPFWLFKTIEVLGTLFIWQFGGYLAFEFFGERKNAARYKQLAEVEFTVKQWD